MLGGTFDPPHLGHLALARHALRELALDRVLLMPARQSPHKPATPDHNGHLHAGAAERLEMCRLLASEEPDIGVSDLEFRREGPSYTVDTLRELHAAHPNSSLTFILGADVARTLPTWREPRQLLELAQLAVAVRTGTAEREVREALGRDSRVRFLNMPAIEISSSLVRDCVHRGAPVVELVGTRVAAFIERHGLYSAPHAGVSAR